NPNLRDYPGFGAFFIDNIGVETKDDGSYRVAGVPGPGLIGVYYHHDPYLRADKRDDEFGTKEKMLNTTPYAVTFPSNYNALARVDPPKGVDSVKRDIPLHPGWSCNVRVLGPDGKPLSGVQSFGLSDGWNWRQSEGMKTAEFTVGYNPHRSRDLVF